MMPDREEVREIFISRKRWNALVKRVETLEKEQDRPHNSKTTQQPAIKTVLKESFFYMPLTGEDCEKLNKFIDEIINH